MANMSYCRFENTNIDLRDCTNALGEALDMEQTYSEFLYNLSSDEQFALGNLRRNAERFLALYAELKGK